MTRKHFEAIAAILKNAAEQAENCHGGELIEFVVEDFVRLCKEENERFNAKRFRQACEPEFE